MIHGDCISDGCYAMTDEKIEEIYSLVEHALNKGQKYVQMHPYPFRMTQKIMDDHTDNIWYDFWLNLKEGHEYFELNRLPPHITVKDKRYIINNHQ